MSTGAPIAPPQTIPPPNDGTQRLYKRLNENGLYTKSYDEFMQQLNAPGGADRLYDKLNSQGLYTKSKQEFVNQLGTQSAPPPGQTWNSMQTPNVPRGTSAQPQQDQGPIWGGQQPTDFQGLFNDAVGLAQRRLPQVIQAATPKAVRNMARQDMFASVRDLQNMARPGANMEAGGRGPIWSNTPTTMDQAWNSPISQGFIQLPPELEQRRNEIVANSVDPFTGDAAQIQQRLANGDPVENVRRIRQIQRDNPAIAQQIDKDAYLLSAQNRGANAQKILENATALQNGDLQFNHRTGELEKPLGFWGSLAHGWRSSNEANNGYADLVDGTPEQNIPKLEAMRAQRDPDKPKEVPTGVGTFSEMVGANGLPMAASAVVDIGSTALGNPEVAPFINAALWGNDAHNKSWYNSYTNTYAQLRNKGIPQTDAEREARRQAEFDSNMDAANAAFMTMAAGQASKLGKPSELLTRGSNQLVYDEAGNLLRTDIPVDPAYQKVLNKIYANTLGDTRTNIGARILREGGPVAAMTGGSQIVKNAYDNKPWDQDVISSSLGQLALHGSLAILANAGATIPGVKKENLAPEVNPDTEDGAKLFIEKPNEPTLSPDNPFNKAKEAYNGRFPGEENTDDQLNDKLKGIAEKAHNPETSEQADNQYGKNLTSAAKELHPSQDNNITGPGTIQQPLPERPIDETPFSGTKNAISRAQRADLNLPEVELPKIGTDAERLQKGKDLVLNGQVNPDEVINRILSNPKGEQGVNANESAAMQYHMYKLKQHLNDYQTAYNLADNPIDKDLLGSQLQQINDKMDAATQANMFSGTDWSEVGNNRQIVVDAAFNPFREKAAIDAAYGGKMPPEAKAKFDAAIKERNAALAQRDKLQQQLDDLNKSGSSDEKSLKMATSQIQAAQQNINSANNKVQQQRLGALNSNKNKLQRAMSFVNRWERRIVLSGLNVLGKLSSAATIGSAAQQPVEFAVSNVWSNVFKKIAEQAPIEGFANAKSLGSYYSEFFDPVKFLANAKKIYTTGASDLTQELGSPHEHYPGWDAMLDTHQVIKDPVKRATFQKALTQYTAWAQNQKDFDISHPLTMEYMRQEAYKRAEYEIFQEDTKVSEYMSDLSRKWEKEGNSGAAKNFLLKFAVPVNKVPLNIARRIGLSSPLGLGKGLWDVGQAYRNGIENLEPEKADAIIRSLTKGSVGTAYWMLGAYLSDHIGGLYTKYDQARKSDPEAMKAGEWEINGKDMPDWLVKPVGHALPFQIMESGSTFNRIVNHFQEDNKSIVRSYFNAIPGTIGATLGDIPIVQEPVHAIEATQDPYALNQLERESERRVIPQILRETGVVPKDLNIISEPKKQKN